MPESYQQVTAIDILFSQSTNIVNLEYVKRKLLQEESKQKKDSKKDYSAGIL